MADSWPGSSYSYRDMGSFCHHIFKQNVIPAIRLSFLAALSRCCEKVHWLIVLLPNASQLLCACAFSHVFQLLPDCSAHHSQLYILCSSTRKSLSVIFGVWMCPGGAVHLRQAYSFLPLSIITYCILEEAPAFMPRRGAVCVHASISFI